MKKIIIALLITFLYIRTAGADIQDRIIKRAIQEIGHGEFLGDNQGPDIKRYLQGREGLSWCSGFVSYILYECDVKDFGYELMARNYLNKAKKIGWSTRYPERGDLIVFWRGSRNSIQGHIGIIEKVDRDYIYTIEGNTGKYPSKVKRLKHKRNDEKILGYIHLKIS